MWRRVALVALCTALALAELERRAEMSPLPFVLGSRYGRSPPRMLAPRNDRFFMGSRYGKRSEIPSNASGTALADPASVRARWPESRALLCEYTGVGPLFRCARASRRRDEGQATNNNQ